MTKQRVALLSGAAGLLVVVVLSAAPRAASASSLKVGGGPDATSTWMDCENAVCFDYSVTLQPDEAATLQSVSGGTKVYQDFMENWFPDAATNPVEPYTQGYEESNNTSSGTQTWYGDQGDGQFNAGCQPSMIEPGSWLLGVCAHSNYNTGGFVFSGSWHIQATFDVGSYFGDMWVGGVVLPTYSFN